MSSLPHNSTNAAGQPRGKPEVYTTASGSLILRPSHDGWVLSDGHGKVLFESHRTRRRSVEVVTDRGEIAVTIRR